MSSSGDLTESALSRVSVDEIMDKANEENFSVASRLLPKRYREHLLAIYGYARFVDDIGDLAAGDRLAQLDWAEQEIRRALSGTATHPIFIRAGATANACAIELSTLVDLISANRQDQVKRRYATYAELLDYCALSANPVGQMVLAVFGESYPLTVSHSDEVCSALQIIEHLQDLAEDHSVDRCYLPAEDLERFGVKEEDLAGTSSGAPLRGLVEFESERARVLLAAGIPLVRLVHGFGRFAIAGFVGGGLAQLEAIERANFEVLAKPVKASKMSLIRHSLRVFLGRSQS